MAATDSAPAVDPVPAPEPVEDVKADDKPAKVTKEKKTKSPKEKKAKMAKSPKAPASHPSYLLMVVEAIGALKERTGSSQYAIAKYLEDHYKTGLPPNFKKTLSIQLRNLTKAGKLVKVKNSFKLADELKKPAKAAAKAPSAAKAPAKAKVTKKPAAGRVKTKSAGGAASKAKVSSAKPVKVAKVSKTSKPDAKTTKAVKAKPLPRKTTSPAPKKAKAKLSAPAKKLAAAPAPAKKPVTGRKPPMVRKMTTPKKAPKSVKTTKSPKVTKPATKAKTTKASGSPAKKAKKACNTAYFRPLHLPQDCVPRKASLRPRAGIPRAVLKHRLGYEKHGLLSTCLLKIWVVDDKALACRTCGRRRQWRSSSVRSTPRKETFFSGQESEKTLGRSRPILSNSNGGRSAAEVNGGA
uniref:H15 domain-containing protein n=2 Tax=Physcomitrium patens TaxID=3218 RepID=A0A2K1KH42_PHYPA|nr:hypothetical protein PHYPA_009475 [Physcomitrium patens]